MHISFLNLKYHLREPSFEVKRHLNCFHMFFNFSTIIEAVANRILTKQGCINIFYDKTPEKKSGEGINIMKQSAIWHV